jgi:ABC-2 type transport system permease protein
MGKRFFEQAWLYYKGQNSGFNFEEFVLMKLMIPILTLIMYCIMASYGFNTNLLTYWVVGNSFLLCTNTCVFTLGTTFHGERYYGRLRSLMVSPSSKLAAMIQKGLFPMLESFISVMVGFTIGSFLFHVDLSNINIGLFLLLTFIAMFSACSFGMILGILGVLTSEMHLLLNCMAYVLAILTGANFPITMLPNFVRVISNCIPLTRSIKAANLLFTSNSITQIMNLMISEVGLGVCYLIVSVSLLKVIEKMAIRNASLEIF